MKKKNFFYGKYFKFITKDQQFVFAMIIANSNEGKTIQIITKDGAHFIENICQVQLIDEHTFIFDINQSDLIIKGTINMGDFHPLKKKVMGPFSNIPFMECKHEIYSMFHTLNGQILCNKKEILFDEGFGYIEGDKGVNFPSQYIWYNSTIKDTAVTFAIANIPFGLFSFIGVLGFVKTKDKEYYLSTYNFVKIINKSQNNIILKKRNLKLEVNINFKEGLNLKAPVKGDMTRYIKENVALSSNYILTNKGQIILENKDDCSSFEWAW